jgi:hypothetical protein
VEFLPEISTHRGKLRSGVPGGTAVHAASYPRHRRLVLDPALLSDPPELGRILVHELFHFAWFRLGNARRWSYEHVLDTERARGELGWSAEMRRRALQRRDIEERTNRWREYVCESFCDTAAWLYAGLQRHPEWTLIPRYRERRADWFRALTESGPLVL